MHIDCAGSCKPIIFGFTWDGKGYPLMPLDGLQGDLVSTAEKRVRLDNRLKKALPC